MKIKNPNYTCSVGAIRDPMIVLYQDRYYMVGTSGPGVRMWSSEDLVNWRFEKLVIDAEAIPADASYKDLFWAPELFIHKGRFYITFNAMNVSQAVEEDYYRGLRPYIAVSNSITGPYRIQPIPLVDVAGANDAHLFLDEDGTVWLFFNTGCMVGEIRMRRINLETLLTYGKEIMIIKKGDAGEWDSIGVEGSFVVRRNGKLYLWYSSWTRGYEMGVAVSDGIGKPFVKRQDNPIISSGTKPPIKYCGHNSCFKLKDGRDVVAYHGHDDGKPESLCVELITYPPTPHEPPVEVEI